MVQLSAMIRTIFLLTIFGVFWIPSLLAQSDTDASVEIKGIVEIPATPSKSSNRFRGRAYRNRSSSTDEDSESQKNQNQVASVIISAHPLSFEPEVNPLEQPVQIVQRDAIFIPEVTPVTVGSVVQFINDDPFFHNVFSLTPGARFNIGRRPTGDVYSQKIPPLSWKVEGLGPISLYCDIHSQMSAIILSLDTPYFTRANDDGSYSLNNLPPGEYEIRAYHPKFDLVIRQITISKDTVEELNFRFQ